MLEQDDRVIVTEHIVPAELADGEVGLEELVRIAVKDRSLPWQSYRDSSTGEEGWYLDLDPSEESAGGYLVLSRQGNAAPRAKLVLPGSRVDDWCEFTGGEIPTGVNLPSPTVVDEQHSDYDLLWECLPKTLWVQKEVSALLGKVEVTRVDQPHVDASSDFESCTYRIPIGSQVLQLVQCFRVEGEDYGGAEVSYRAEIHDGEKVYSTSAREIALKVERLVSLIEGYQVAISDIRESPAYRWCLTVFPESDTVRFFLPDKRDVSIQKIGGRSEQPRCELLVVCSDGQEHVF